MIQTQKGMIVGEATIVQIAVIASPVEITKLPNEVITKLNDNLISQMGDKVQ